MMSIGNKYHSKRERWFIPLVIPYGIHIHTLLDPVFLVGVNLSPIHTIAMLAWRVFVAARHFSESRNPYKNRTI